MNKYEKFMRESNLIEGEDRVNPGDVEAVAYAIQGVKNLNDILNLHSIWGKHLDRNWVGKLRMVDVRVGTYCPPSCRKVFALMNKYIEKLPTMDSWLAHNEFEKIHPFQDGNGRVGRLIWLNKAIPEGYNFSIPFLQAYYYQSLSKYEKGL